MFYHAHIPTLSITLDPSVTTIRTRTLDHPFTRTLEHPLTLVLPLNHSLANLTHHPSRWPT